MLSDENNNGDWEETDLLMALRNREFFLVYQPIMSVQTEAVVGLEALIRWDRGGGCIVPFGEIASAVESSGLIQPLGIWGIEAVARQIAKWQERGLEIPRISVNISPWQLLDDKFSATVMATFEKAGVSADHVAFELTEGRLPMDMDEVEAIFEQWSDSGIQLIIDDLGTGYASLERLLKLDVDGIKIHQLFLQARDKQRALKIIKALVDLGHALGVSVTIKGIEAKAHLSVARAIGCDAVQGYHVGEPVKAEYVGLRMAPETI